MNCLYLMSCNEFTKIGIASSHDAEARRNEMQTGNPYPIKIEKLYLVENARQIEAILHKTFFAYRVRREWFHLPADAIAQIEKVVAEIGIPAKPSKPHEWGEFSLRSRGRSGGVKRYGFYCGRRPLPELGYLTECDAALGQIERINMVQP